MLAFHMGYICWLFFFFNLLCSKSAVSPFMYLELHWCKTEDRFIVLNLSLRGLDYTPVDWWNNSNIFFLGLKPQKFRGYSEQQAAFIGKKSNFSSLLQLVLFVLQFSLRKWRYSESWFCNNPLLYVHKTFAV